MKILYTVAIVCMTITPAAAVSTDTSCGIPGDAEHVCTWIAESK